MKINYNAGQFNHGSAGKIVVTCPECGKGGTFDTIQKSNDLLTSNNKYSLGHRVCPNPECKCHIFFIKNRENSVIITYPHLRIDFDSTNIPDTIKESLEESIGCESINAYVAAAIMIRRTLECLCDNRGATGKNLKEKIGNLKSKIILPEELFEAMDNLRLLGNDAAHIESKDYDNIGKEEVQLAIELTKEVLKACYQYDDLLKRLESYKKSDSENN